MKSQAFPVTAKVTSTNSSVMPSSIVPLCSSIYNSQESNNKSESKKKRKKRNKKLASTDISDSFQLVNLTNVCDDEGPAIKHVVSAEALEKTIFELLEKLLTHFSQPNTKNFVASTMPALQCPDYRRSLKGFTNFKNSCYLSACIQALMSIPAFVAIIDHISVGLHRFFAHNGCLQTYWSEDLASTTPLLRLLVLLLDQMSPFLPDGSSIHNSIPTEFGYIQTAPALKLDQHFVKILCFEESHQQDAADCISKLLTQLHEEMICLLKKFKKPAPNILYEGEDLDTESSWTKIGTKGKKFETAIETKVDSGEPSPISHLFGGLLVSRSSYNKMTRVADKSSTSIKERFFILPLDIKNDKVYRVEDSLALFSKGETISDFRDPECGECVVMSRRIFIDHLPPVLLLQLNRFYFSSSPITQEFGVKKVLKGIPIYKTLSIREDIISKERVFSRAQGLYRLHAIIFHVGYQANRGHYTVSFIHTHEADPNMNNFFYFDDEHVFSLQGSDDSSDLRTLLGTHQPFDSRTGKFRNIKSENGSIAPSISEQPRTPYILVYISCFHS